MAVCNSIKKNTNKVCIADLNKKVIIQYASSSANNAPNANAESSFTALATVWAMVKTTPNREFVNGVNIENGVNTDFYIRHDSSIDFSKKVWIEFNNERFKVINVENIDFENRFMRLRAVERGVKTLNAAQR